ncbi:MAG: Na/Pi cotransporter family protein [Pseudomonadota bacterium]
MDILFFLVQIVGATLLLLYAVRMVRTGIERAFGSSFKRVVTRANGAVRSAATGLGLAVVLQSSAAVVLLAAGFAGSGLLSFSSGIATALGADLGSALLIQLLSFETRWLAPTLLALGAGLFLNSSRRGPKQTGRILLGIAFILVSLRFLREAMVPIQQSSFLPSVAAYLDNDHLTAFVIGAGLAFVMHSSVAVVLMCVTLVAIDAIPLPAGVALVLGANLGSALIPVWLSRSLDPSARRIPLANLLLRGVGAVVALWAVNGFALIAPIAHVGAAQALIVVHVAFNSALLVWLPFGRLLERPFVWLFPEEVDEPIEAVSAHRSVLTSSALDTPNLANSSLKREILRMLHLVEDMVKPVMDLYESGNKQQARLLMLQDKHVNLALDGIRQFMAQLPQESMNDEERQLAHALVEYAICVESAGDTVVKRLIPRALQKAEEGVDFSIEGHRELLAMHEKVVANVALAANVLISSDLESARLLLEEKVEMTQMERASRKRHLRRLGAGGATSFGSSNIHLETLAAYKEMNSQIASVAYPILHRGGQLLETRLIERPERSHSGRGKGG